MTDLATDVAAKQASTDQERTRLLAGEADVFRQQAANTQAEQAALKGPNQEAMQSADHLSQAAEKPLPPSEAVALNYEPHHVNKEEVQKLSWALVGLSLLGGAVSRGNWLGVSSTLNGAMKGFIQGDKAQAQKELEDFRQKYETAEKHDKAALDRVRMVLDNQNLSLNAKRIKTEIIASEFGMEDVRLAAQKGYYDTMLKQTDARENALLRSRTQLETSGILQMTGGGGGAGGVDEAVVGMVKTGEPLYEVSPGMGKLSGSQRTELQRQALAEIQKENPGFTAEDAGRELTRRRLEFGADKKESQTAGTIAGRASVGENELILFAPKALAISDKIPRGSFVPFARLLQIGEKNISDADLKELFGRTNAILNAYDVLAARGGTDKDKRAENRKNLETADSPAAYRRALEVMIDEARMAKAGARQSEQMLDDLPGGTPRSATSQSGWKVEKVQ